MCVNRVFKPHYTQNKPHSPIFVCLYYIIFETTLKENLLVDVILFCCS